MKKYTLTGEYTIIYVKEQTIEASSHEEAEEKFNKILLDTDARNCRPNYMGWEITENYESLEDISRKWADKYNSAMSLAAGMPIPEVERKVRKLRIT